MSSRWKYIFLSLALIEFAIGFSDLRPNTFFYMGRPLGAILLGLYLVAQLLERESALLDQQNRAAGAALNKPVWEPALPKYSRNEVATHPVPTMALAS